MVTFLPRRQSTAERFGRAFGAAGESLSQEIPKHMMEQEEKRNENEAAKRFGIDLSGIKDPEMRRKALEYALRGEESTGNFAHEKELAGMKFAHEKDLAGINNAAKADKLSGKEGIEDNHARDIGQKAFNTVASLLKKGNLGFGAKANAAIFGGKRARDVGEFTSAMGGLEAMLVDMVNKGTLSDTRFRYITETLLPKANDRDETIRGKLQGLSAILGLDPSELGVEEKREEGSRKTLEMIFG